MSLSSKSADNPSRLLNKGHTKSKTKTKKQLSLQRKHYFKGHSFCGQYSMNDRLRFCSELNKQHTLCIPTPLLSAVGISDCYLQPAADNSSGTDVGCISAILFSSARLHRT